jgi:hypothetical protein
VIQISKPGRQILAAEIASLEEAFGAKLPADYREFLLLNNGGLPTHDTVDIDGMPGSPTDIQVFFGIDTDIASSDLAWNLQVIRDRLPGFDALPIACDSGGNLFCLTAAKAGKAEIVFCDMPGGSFYKVTPGISVYKVAPDFSAFTNKIRHGVH